MAASRFIAIFSSQPQQLYETAPSLAPRIEVCPPDGLLLEVSPRYERETLHRISRFVRWDAAIGGAGTRTAAILAARFAPGTILSYGREQAFLESLPVQALSTCSFLERETLAALERWGIRTLGELQRLPAASLAARLGRQAERLQRLARGEDVSLFRPYQVDEAFRVEEMFDWTLDSAEPLTFVLGGMLESLCGELKQRGLAAEQADLTLHLAEGRKLEKRIGMAAPLQDPRTLLSLIRLHLQKISAAAGIRGVALQLKPVKPRFFQHSLLQREQVSPEKLSHLLARLESLVGAGNLGTPALEDTHRPDAVRMRPFEINLGDPHPPVEPAAQSIRLPASARQLSLRRLRPPVSISVKGEEMLSCAGPWKSSGDWWGENDKASPWDREEWDIEFSNGSICRVFWDRRQQQWFLEGVYD